MSIISRPSLVGGSPSTPLSGLFLVDVGRAFIELSLSELKLAQRKLDLYPSYIAQLESRIGRIVARVVLKEFYDSGSWDLERSSSGYRTMISSLWSDQWRDYLFSKYEVLGYIPSIVHNELISLDRILSRLELYALDIEASFGIGYSTVVDIQCMGDYHATGTVSLLKFASGKSLYYKPHLSSNAEFIDLLLGHVGCQ